MIPSGYIHLHLVYESDERVKRNKECANPLTRRSKHDEIDKQIIPVYVT